MFARGQWALWGVLLPCECYPHFVAACAVALKQGYSTKSKRTFPYSTSFFYSIPMLIGSVVANLDFWTSLMIDK